MLDENQVTESQEIEQIDYKAMYEKTLSDLDKVAAKKDQLLNETKKAKAEREQATLEAQKASEEKAQRDGEYEKLWKTTKQEKDELMQKLHQLENNNRNEKLQVAAMRVSTELADGDNAELLSDFIMRKLEKMADESGALSADVLDAVKSDFKSNNKYKSLLRVSKAVGGGAPGSQRSASETVTLTRNEFAQLNATKQVAFMSKVRSGSASLTDN